MTYRMTVVLEYPSRDHAPQVNARTKAKDLGDGEVCALQFSDALRELEVLEDHATEEAKELAWKASESYPGAVPRNEAPWCCLCNTRHHLPEPCRPVTVTGDQ